jgi:oligopeptidase B
MQLAPPIAKIIPTQLCKFDDVRIDNYYWLKYKENPDVIEYIRNENIYYELSSASKILQKELYEEIKARIEKDIPYLYNGYYYITSYVNDEYPIYSRKKENLDAIDEIILNCNEYARGYKYFQISRLNISSYNKYIAFAIDTNGDGVYTVFIKDMHVNAIIDKIEFTSGEVAWANNIIFYTKFNEITLCCNKVYKHKLNTDAINDVLVYTELDASYSVEVKNTRKYVIIKSSNSITTEIRILADSLDEEFALFQERVDGLEYDIHYCNNNFYILTNKDDAHNFKIMKTDELTTQKEKWTDIIPHRENILIEAFYIFKNFLVLIEKSNGLNIIRIIPFNGGNEYYLQFKSETYIINILYNDFNTDILYFNYHSMIIKTLIAFNMNTKEANNTLFVVCENNMDKYKYNAPLECKYNASVECKYIEERIWATANDGAKIPISIVYKKDIKRDGLNPLLLCGYGAYGYSINIGISANILSLIERGFIYAVAHVRGEGYLGKYWHDDGRLLQKINTFTDFIDCSKFLIKEKYTSPQHLYAKGWSAGGLLIGTVANMAPELYNGLIINVPFFDALTTMLDETIPLTTSEYSEWGNPNDKRYYDYIKSYSPYDNIKAQKYPSMYITSGLCDTSVQYWESAKMVAKLRAYKTDDNKIFLDTNLHAGHGGATGRFNIIKESIKEIVFLLNLENIG